MKAPRGVNWDRVGGTASFLCAIHCALSGVALGLLSTLGLGFFTDSRVDWLFLGIAVIAGTFAAVTGFRRHGDARLAVALIIGLAILIARQVFFAHDHAGHNHGIDPVSTALSLVGASFVIGFHVGNSVKSHRSCPGCRASSKT